jgi:tetratricopeptide (TPR) repeat protein
MRLRSYIAVLCFAAVILLPGYTQVQEETGDGAMADRYVLWAQRAVSEGRWAEAEAALERAAAFGDVSSDLSYLLGLVRSRLDRPRGSVLEALRRAAAADRWRRYTPEAGGLLEAETLLRLRNYAGTLRLLDSLPESADAARFRLLALKGLGDAVRFRGAASAALERYPRDPRPARILFTYFHDRPAPAGTDRDLVVLALRRLPVLLEADPELAYLALPFIADLEEARRLLGAYRAVGRPNPASIPGALRLGMLDDIRALEELFFPPPSSPAPSGLRTLDRSLLQSVWGLLRSPEGRDRFRRNLLAYSGVINEDGDGDGYDEMVTRYQNGILDSYSLDADQDGLPELRIRFAGGSPEWTEAVMLPERSGESFAYPVSDEERDRMGLRWERYPFVLWAERRGVRYIPRPLEFSYAPLRFSDFFGILYPEPDAQPLLSRRALVSFSQFIERRGNFDGSVERVELDRGIPRRAVETFSGQVVSVTEFRLGRPITQSIDQDLDGRIETLRRFRPGPAMEELDDSLAYGEMLEFSESDWDGDGVFEYGEEHSGGMVRRSWDMDRDGIREYGETFEDR